MTDTRKPATLDALDHEALLYLVRGASNWMLRIESWPTEVDLVRAQWFAASDRAQAADRAQLAASVRSCQLGKAWSEALSHVQSVPLGNTRGWKRAWAACETARKEYHAAQEAADRLQARADRLHRRADRLYARLQSLREGCR